VQDEQPVLLKKWRILAGLDFEVEDLYPDGFWVDQISSNPIEFFHGRYQLV